MPFTTDNRQNAVRAAQNSATSRQHKRDRKDSEALVHIRSVVSLDCYSLRQIADSLNRAGIKTVTGKPWKMEQVRLLFQRHPGRGSEPTPDEKGEAMAKAFAKMLTNQVAGWRD